MVKILVIDDEPGIRFLLSKIMELEGYEVLQAQDRATGLDRLRENPGIGVVLCDVFLPDGNGVEMIRELHSISPRVRIILLTAHGNIEDGVKAIKNGAFDYITKGDDNNKIIPIVSRAVDDIQASGDIPRAEVRSACDFESVIGKSAAIMKAVNLARKVAVTPVPVLLTGETGTGKEVFAKSIHNSSPRSDRPFIALNCSAFSKELLESELFGHKAGAFTGAIKNKTGLFEAADKGTIFLDEIGEMAYELQAKLLRVLETGEFMKIGETKTTKVDVRVISATNRNLKEEIEKGNFREDLFFRLSVFQIELPPLRERREDICLLAESFLHKLGSRMGFGKITISPESMRLLKGYSWPGNVRELQNVIERAIIVCDRTIMPDDLPVDIQKCSESVSAGNYDLASVERQHIAKVLRYTGGNKTEAARLLKIGLTTLYRKLEEGGAGD